MTECWKNSVRRFNALFLVSKRLVRRTLLLVAAGAVLGGIVWYAELRNSSLAMPIPRAVEVNRAVVPRQSPPVRLNYDLQINYRRGVVTLINRDVRPWTNVQATVGHGDMFFGCRTITHVNPGEALVISAAECVRANGSQEVGTIRVEATEGQILTGIEPGLRLLGRKP